MQVTINNKARTVTLHFHGVKAMSVELGRSSNRGELVLITSFSRDEDSVHRVPVEGWHTMEIAKDLEGEQE